MDQRDLVMDEPYLHGETPEEYIRRMELQFIEDDEFGDDQWEEGAQEELADLRRDEILESQEREAFEW